MKNNNTRDIVVLAGGCFWGLEDLIRTRKGSIDTEVGYSLEDTMETPRISSIRGTLKHFVSHMTQYYFPINICWISFFRFTTRQH